jgi:hypothetical protein
MVLGTVSKNWHKLWKFCYFAKVINMQGYFLTFSPQVNRRDMFHELKIHYVKLAQTGVKNRSFGICKRRGKDSIKLEPTTSTTTASVSASLTTKLRRPLRNISSV